MEDSEENIHVDIGAERVKMSGSFLPRLSKDFLMLSVCFLSLVIIPHYHQPTALQSVTSFLHAFPVFYHASKLIWRWWLCPADCTGNVLMKHQRWATGLTFAMFRVEKGVPVDQFILWFLEDMP